MPIIWTGETLSKSFKIRLEPIKPAAPVIKIVLFFNSKLYANICYISLLMFQFLSSLPLNICMSQIKKQYNFTDKKATSHIFFFEARSGFFFSSCKKYVQNGQKTIKKSSAKQNRRRWHDEPSSLNVQKVRFIIHCHFRGRQTSQSHFLCASITFRLPHICNQNRTAVFSINILISLCE